MKNLDVLEMEKMQIVQKMNDAIKEDDPEKFQESFLELCTQIEKNVMQRALTIVESTDERVLSDRGVRQLTSKEKTYYQSVIDAMRSVDPKAALSNLDVVMPETIIESVLEDIRTNHPLLSRIQMHSVTGLTRMIMNTNGYQKATWGKLTAAIVQELTSGFKDVDVTPNKLSAFLPISKAMLELGPQWLDAYVREVLYEAFANGLEDGVINGTGKDMPIGMIRHVGDNVTVTGGVYPDKNVMTITEFDDTQLGKATAILSINEKGESRAVKDLILLVNPSDYFTKVLAASRRPVPGGGYVSALPFDIEIIPSPAVKVGTAIYGIGSLYFLGVGLEQGGRILYSDEYQFLEDNRVYLIKGYANGFAVDDTAFIVFDISGLKPSYYKVVTISPETETENANLIDIKIGANVLNPEFSESVTSYTVTTEDASNAITVIPKKSTAEIEIYHDGESVQNGGRVTWTEGKANEISIIVTDGATTKEYTVSVTKA